MKGRFNPKNGASGGILQASKGTASKIKINGLTG